MESPEPVQYDERAQRTVDEMIAAEARHIAQRKAQEQEVAQECECKDGMFPRGGLTDRRKFLFAAGSLAGAVSTPALAQPAAQEAPPGAIHFDVPADPTKQQGRAVLADGGYGSRSQFESEVRWRFPTTSTRPGA
jgi:sulfane dehydrogenase subunit SoxC